MRNIAVIIILYNEFLDDSQAYCSLKPQNLDIYVFDNSEEQYRRKNEKFQNYFTLEKNVGLAIGYNVVIKEIKDKYKYIVTSDSDTKFPTNYIEKFKSCEQEDIKVYVPQVCCISTQKKESPKKYKNKYMSLFNLSDVKDFDEVGQYYRAINSGTIYSSEIFDKVDFNERLLVENIDHDMFDKLKINKIKQKEIPTIIKQSFALTDVEQKFIYGRINRTYVDHLEYYKWIWYPFTFCLHIKKMIEYRKFKYLKAYYNIYIKRK